MRLTHQKLIVEERRKAWRKTAIKFPLDSGAVYDLVPAGRLRRLGITPWRAMEFVLADGTTVKAKVGDAYLESRGAGGAAPVIFDEAGDEPLRGAKTLESLGLVLNPVSRQWVPRRWMSASTR